MSTKMKDARQVIRAKQRQKLLKTGLKSRLNTSGIVDARQILKMKQNSKNRKPGISSRNQPPATFFKKQFGQVFSQQKNAKRRFPNSRIQLGNQGVISQQNRSQIMKGVNKKVLVNRSGLLKVTSSSYRNVNAGLVDNPEDKCIVSDRSGITITMRNKPSQSISFGDPMEEDDLERMTLQDLGITSLTTHPSTSTPFIVPKVTTHVTAPPSSTQTLFNHLRGEGKTMVADTVNPSQSQSCWKVLVTNLQPSVTEQDIIELFGCVGTMKNANLLRPGFAVVEYYHKKSAIQACDIYHNRLLDGQPMQCVMETDSHSRTPVTMRLGDKYVSSPTSVSRFPRQTAASIFSQSSGRVYSSPRSVEFTVKVP